jgi:CheY-like chemotaxis protein
MSHSPAHQRNRILVIDDDDVTRKITELLVQSLGHDAEPARDGIEGLAKVQLGVDLVLLDVVMPGLDGFEVGRRIRQDPCGQDVPVIMVTSMVSREDRLRAVEAGANDFIAKPVDATELRIRSASLLKMKEAQDGLKTTRGASKRWSSSGRPACARRSMKWPKHSAWRTWRSSIRSSGWRLSPSTRIRSPPGTSSG